MHIIENYSAMKRKNWYIQQPWWISRYLYYSIYVTFLKWQNFRNREQISAHSLWKWGGRKVDVVIKAQKEESLWRFKCSIFEDDSGYASLSMIKRYKSKHTHKWIQVQWSTSIFWLWYCTRVLQYVVQCPTFMRVCGVNALWEKKKKKTTMKFLKTFWRPASSSDLNWEDLKEENKQTHKCFPLWNKPCTLYF